MGGGAEAFELLQEPFEGDSGTRGVTMRELCCKVRCAAGTYACCSSMQKPLRSGSGRPFVEHSFLRFLSAPHPPGPPLSEELSATRTVFMFSSARATVWCLSVCCPDMCLINVVQKGLSTCSRREDDQNVERS